MCGRARSCNPAGGKEATYGSAGCGNSGRSQERRTGQDLDKGGGYPDRPSSTHCQIKAISLKHDVFLPTSVNFDMIIALGALPYLVVPPSHFMPFFLCLSREHFAFAIPGVRR